MKNIFIITFIKNKYGCMSRQVTQVGKRDEQCFCQWSIHFTSQQDVAEVIYWQLNEYYL